MVHWRFSSEKWTKIGQRPPPVFGGGRIIDVVLELPENTQKYPPRTRALSRFIDQVGHETTYASSGNKHSFTK